MIKVEGKSVFGGIAIGPIGILKKKEKYVNREHIENVEDELKRYHTANEHTEKQIT